MPSLRSKQTRLSFEPLPASSPAKDSQPAAIRDRAAAVTISPSHSCQSRKKIKISDSFLPTPAASSQPSSMPRRSQREPTSSPLPLRTNFMNRSHATRSQFMSSPVTRSRNRQNVARVPGDGESERDEPVRPTKRTRLASSSIAVHDDDGEDHEPPAVPGQTARKLHDRVVKVPSADEDDSDELPILPNRRTQSSQIRQESDSDIAEIDSPSLAKKRPRLKPPPTTPRKHRRQEDLDLEEDLDFLEPISPQTTRELRKNFPSERKNARQTALEKLKRRRQRTTAGASLPVEINSQDDDGSEPANEDYAEEGDEGIEVEYNDEEEEEDFIVSNDDAEDGDAEIPFAFKLQVMKPRELFKFAVEWMCQKRLNPAFAIDDEVYRGAFQRLDHFVRGMGGSKFQSAAWTPAFVRALNARPVMSEERFTNDGLHDRCDACNRSGHPPTWELQLSGSPYDKTTLEDVSEGEDEDSWKETKLPSTDVIYHLGKFCMANARTAHALAHWRYHLHQWVEDYLDVQGYLKAKEVVKRDKWSTKKRQEYANGVVDKMEETKEIQALYRDFKAQIEQAQNQSQYSDRRGSSP